jgi:hypothetical protein
MQTRPIAAKAAALPAIYRQANAEQLFFGQPREQRDRYSALQLHDVRAMIVPYVGQLLLHPTARTHTHGPLSLASGSKALRSSMPICALCRSAV